jgi:hypothetical protein
VATLASFMAAVAPRLAAVHPVGPAGLSRRGCWCGSFLGFGLQRPEPWRQRETYRGPESKQGKRSSPRDHVRFDSLAHFSVSVSLTLVELDGGKWTRSPWCPTAISLPRPSRKSQAHLAS